MASEISNHYKYLLATGAGGDFSSDDFIIILMQSGFVFDEDADEEYADVSASELATANGYTQNNKALAGVAVTQDNANDRINITWTNVTWSATPGDIGPTPCALILNNTLANEPIVGCIDFGGDQTEPNGGTATIANIVLRLT